MSPARVWAALAVVYVVWGSTYLGILLAIDTIPVFLSMGIRFVIAGGLLYVWAVRRGDVTGDRPGRRQWAAALIVGALLFVGGNSLVAWSETRVDTGIAALLIAAVPLWMALFDRVANGQRLSRTALLGLLVGFGGVALLAWPTGRAASTRSAPWRCSSRALRGRPDRSSLAEPHCRGGRWSRRECRCSQAACCSCSSRARPAS